MTAHCGIFATIASVLSQLLYYPSHANRSSPTATTMNDEANAPEVRIVFNRVRLLGQTGTPLLGLRFTVHDPERTLAGLSLL
jgi:hypothetical protein